MDGMGITAENLAGWLQKNLDLYTAEQAVSVASSAIARTMGTKLTPTAATWSTAGTGDVWLSLPHYPITAVSGVTVNGVAQTGVALVGQLVYLAGGFGWRYASPPDAIVVSYTYGYADLPDELREQAFTLAARFYENPSLMAREQIDDYMADYGAAAAAADLSPAEAWRLPSIA